MVNKERKASPDVPYHLAFATYKKDELSLDPEQKKRHKTRCIHYEKNKDRCTASKSGCYGMKCHGSNQCYYYAESISEWQNRKSVYCNDDEYMEKLKAGITNRPPAYSRGSKGRYQDKPVTQTKSSSVKPNQTAQKATAKQKSKPVASSVKKKEPTTFQSSCKFYEKSICKVLNKECEMYHACLFRDNVK